MVHPFSKFAVLMLAIGVLTWLLFRVGLAIYRLFLSEKYSSRLIWAGGATSLAVGAAILLRRPFFGLATVPLWLAIGLLLVQRRRVRELRERELESIRFLLTLLGLLRAGIGLPSALLLLAQTSDGGFGRLLRSAFSSLNHGSLLGPCLEQLRSRAGMRGAGAILLMMESAYRRGLPVIPLLERTLPGLEAERVSAEKVRRARNSCLAQAGVAMVIPWILAGTLIFFSPEMFASLRESSGVMVGSLVWESLGVIQVWRSCQYS